MRTIRPVARTDVWRCCIDELHQMSEPITEKTHLPHLERSMVIDTEELQEDGTWRKMAR